MEQQDNKYEKILFRFYSNVLDKWTVETKWARALNSKKGHYQLDSIPFYAAFASDDIVFSEYDNNEKC